MGRLLPAVALVALVLSAAPALPQRLDVFVGSREDAAISYTLGPVDNPVARLDQRVRSGGLTLRRAEGRGYLDAVLEALDVPSASQSLVFSQTSAQADYVSMRRPRALYFADDVAVGWVPGAPVLELAALDARQGTVFYTLDQQQAGAPRFERQTSCLLCHQTWETLGVPGWQVLSTFPMSDDPRAYAGGIAMDHRTPFGERWGGWFVTRRSGNVPHMGNRPVVLPAHEVEAARRRPTRHLDSVRDEIEPLYLSSCSEVAAQLVLAHQSHAANLITRAGWEARVAAAGAGTPAAGNGAEARTRAMLASTRVREAAQDLARYLVFEDEAPLPVPVDSGCGFVEAFTRRGPRDPQGRSLRDFELRTRTFRYPVSYMVYSPAFSALDEVVRRLVYAEMAERLRRPDRRGGPPGPDAASRRAALAILQATVPDAALIPAP